MTFSGRQMDQTSKTTNKELIRAFEAVLQKDYPKTDQSIIQKIIFEYYIWFYENKTRQTTVELKKMIQLAEKFMKTIGVYQKSKFENYLLFFETLNALFDAGLLTYENNVFFIRTQKKNIQRIKKECLTKFNFEQK